MKANELRFGNLVDYYGNVVTINSIDDMEVGFSDYETSDYPYLEEIKPIPLTEEWLIRFGFEKINHIHNGIYFLHRLIKISIYTNGMIELRGSAGWNRIQDVNQLQNLYFALTGTELTLQP